MTDILWVSFGSLKIFHSNARLQREAYSEIACMEDEDCDIAGLETPSDWPKFSCLVVIMELSIST